MPFPVIDYANIACVLLAAGESRRFGGGKLSVLLDGLPVGLHAARMLSAMPFAAKIAVTATDGPDFASQGFTQVSVSGDTALSASIAAGVAAIGDDEVDAVLFVLADMPLVPAAHIAALIAGFDGDRIATRVGTGPQPPALFARRHFAALRTLDGDRGARALLDGAAKVTLDDRLAIDIDTPDGLRRAEAILAARAMTARNP